MHVDFRTEGDKGVGGIIVNKVAGTVGCGSKLREKGGQELRSVPEV